MKRALGYFLAATGGAFLGALSTAVVLTRKHREELKNVREELYAQYKTKVAEQTERATSDTLAAMAAVKAELEDLRAQKRDEALFAKVGAELGHEPTAKEVEVQTAKAYVIRPDEFGTEGYLTLRYIFFPDQDEYLNADGQTLVGKDEVEKILGDLHPEDHFGEFDDEMVYVRNDECQTDVVIYLEEGAPDTDEDD